MTACTECGRAFLAQSTKSAYCSGTCRQRAYRKRVAAERAQTRSAEPVTPEGVSAKLDLIAALVAELCEQTDAFDRTDVAKARWAAVQLHQVVADRDVAQARLDGILRGG